MDPVAVERRFAELGVAPAVAEIGEMRRYNFPTGTELYSSQRKSCAVECMMRWEVSPPEFLEP